MLLDQPGLTPTGSPDTEKGMVSNERSPFAWVHSLDFFKACLQGGTGRDQSPEIGWGRGGGGGVCATRSAATSGVISH